MTTRAPQILEPIDEAWIAKTFGAAARPSARANGSAEALHALAEALRGQLRKRDAEIAALKADVAALRSEVAVAKRLDEFERRMDRIDGQRASHLRVAT